MRNAIAKCILSQTQGQEMMLSISFCISGVSADREAIPVVRMQAGSVELLDPIALAEAKGHVLKLKQERKVTGTPQMRTVHLAKSFLFRSRPQATILSHGCFATKSNDGMQRCLKM